MRRLRGITTSIHRKEIVASQLFYFLRLTPFLVLVVALDKQAVKGLRSASMLRAQSPAEGKRMQ
jgi:hypothetical protein